MTYKSIKLLALAVICGCSLIGLALVPWGKDANWLIIVLAWLGTSLWFVTYWFLCKERR
jgi:hypothetical protein